MDIRNECGLSEALAENIKKAYGICCPDKLQNMSDKYLRIKLRDSSRTKEVGIKFLSEIVTARMKEIFEAVLFIIQESGMADDLGAGIVLTGGGAKLTNCSKLLEERSGYSVRVGQVNGHGITMPAECLSPDAAGCLGLLFAGRGLDKVWFVTDPEDPRFNAIDTETASVAKDGQTEENPVKETETKETSEPEASDAQTPRKEAAIPPVKDERNERNLFGESVPEPKTGLKRPRSRPRESNSVLNNFGTKILRMMDSDEAGTKKGKSEDLFGDNLFGEDI